MTYNRAVTLCKQMQAVKLNPTQLPAWCRGRAVILLSLGNIMIRIQRIYLGNAVISAVFQMRWTLFLSIPLRAYNIDGVCMRLIRFR